MARSATRPSPGSVEDRDRGEARSWGELASVGSPYTPRPLPDRRGSNPVPSSASVAPSLWKHGAGRLAEVASGARREEVALVRLAAGHNRNDVIRMECDTVLAGASAAVLAAEPVALEHLEPELSRDGLAPSDRALRPRVWRNCLEAPTPVWTYHPGRNRHAVRSNTPSPESESGRE